jgi:hypothetical protein
MQLKGQVKQGVASGQMLLGQRGRGRKGCKNLQPDGFSSIFATNWLLLIFTPH